jgi:hypothetical protein
MPTLTKEIIEAAIAGFEAQKQNIDAQIVELRARRTGTPAASTAPPKQGRIKHKFSPEALQRMREGQRRRWAAVRGQSAAPAEASKPKRKLSAAGRKAIVTALKKRWAAKRAANA